MHEKIKLTNETSVYHHKISSLPPRAKIHRYLITAAASTLIYLFLISQYLPQSWRGISGLQTQPSNLERFQECSIRNLISTGLPFLASAAPLSLSEYVLRRNNAARALHTSNLSALILEPSYASQYYFNLSQFAWEPWEPEERPFLLIIQPVFNSSREKVKTRIIFLVPSFEEERANLSGLSLGKSEEEEVVWVTYEEHWNPYLTLLDSWPKSSETNREIAQPMLMVDEELRDFISRGLSTNGFHVQGLGGEVEAVRQVKTENEIGILRAVNTGTVEAVRAVRKCLVLGLKESEVAEVLDNTLRSAGLEPFFDIVLFDENASNPHGGTNGSKVLEAETLVLIDVGAHLYGYSSDICRTFFPPSSTLVNPSISPLGREKLSVWALVLSAQAASIAAMTPNATAASIDIAARDVISTAGYGDAFTHRVGHGIGIKAHESPYLHKGNGNRLRPGMTFTSEPGVYLVGKFGVRHEDVLVVKEDGVADVLSGRRAVSPWEP